MSQTAARGLVLITGGVRSGKSSFAEKLALDSGKKFYYLATARVEDKEMRDRVERHRERRPEEVTTIEEAFEPERVIGSVGGPETVILLDCLTLLLTNRFLRELDRGGALRQEEEIHADRELLDDAAEKTLDYVRRFATVAAGSPAEVIVVTNEVGMGVVPDYPAGRVFRDLAGRANQAVAACADQVWLVLCGIPQRFK